MALMQGSCRFGLWWVHVVFEDTVVHRVRFSTEPLDGPVPPALRRYLAGMPEDLGSLRSAAEEDWAPFSRIYRAVRSVGYGRTATYGAIADAAGTTARVVGLAMKRNPTPLVIPCHRITAKDGIGGFTPDIAIKRALLAMEAKNMPNINEISANPYREG